MPLVIDAVRHFRTAPDFMICNWNHNILFVLQAVLLRFFSKYLAMDMSVTDGVPWLRNYFRLVQEGRMKKDNRSWIEHPATVYSILKWF